MPQEAIQSSSPELSDVLSPEAAQLLLPFLLKALRQIQINVSNGTLSPDDMKPFGELKSFAIKTLRDADGTILLHPDDVEATGLSEVPPEYVAQPTPVRAAR